MSDEDLRGPSTPQGWAAVWALAAVGIAGGLDPDAALTRAIAWLRKHGNELPTEATAREAFRLMAFEEPDPNEGLYLDPSDIDAGSRSTGETH